LSYPARPCDIVYLAKNPISLVNLNAVAVRRRVRPVDLHEQAVRGDSPPNAKPVPSISKRGLKREYVKGPRRWSAVALYEEFER
jgi:hypothetical protein